MTQMDLKSQTFIKHANITTSVEHFILKKTKNKIRSSKQKTDVYKLRLSGTL